MADFDDLGCIGAEPKNDRFAPFDTSKLQEAIGGLSTVDEAMKEARVGSRLQDVIEQMTLGGRALRASDAIAEQIRAATAPLGAGVHSRLSELDKASDVLRNALNPRPSRLGSDADLASRIAADSDFTKYINGSTERDRFIHELPPMPPLPRNPIFETNALLEKLTDEFADIKAVTAATSEVQEKQAELIAELLRASVEGAAGQAKAAREQQQAAAETLKVAKVSLRTSIILPVILMLVGFGLQALLG